MDANSNLTNPELTTIFFAILVKRLGGTAKITQSDVDDVAYNLLEEEGREDGSIEFRLVERKQSA
jgi:hypothetical protein